MISWLVRLGKLNRFWTYFMLYLFSYIYALVLWRLLFGDQYLTHRLAFHTGTYIYATQYCITYA